MGSLTGSLIKTLPKHFYLVEEVISFNFVGAYMKIG